MSDWPSVWILFITFRRTKFALRAIDALKAHLKYSNLHWHICDDGSKLTDDGTERNHIEVLAEAINGDVTWHEMGTPWDEFNMGGNTNRGIEIAQDAGCHLYFTVHDDTILEDDLDLHPHVCVLEEHPNAGFIRFNRLSDGLAGVITGYSASRLSSVEQVYLRLIREWSLQNPWKSDTYLHAFQPALIHQRFYDAYGYYPEHYNPGLTECGMCALYNQSELGEDGPQILVPVHFWAKGVNWTHLYKRAHAYKELTGSDSEW